MSFVHPDRGLVAARTPGRRRLMTVLEGPDAASYALAVARVAPVVERALGPEVVANRAVLARSARPTLCLEPWRLARTRLLSGARRRAATAGALLVADVRACYPSIGSELVADRLGRMGCAPEDVRRLSSLLGWFERAGVPGLPIGPEPSAVLANAVLTVADDALSQTGARHLRWVDDFWVFARDAGEAREAFGALSGALAGVKLELASEKTRLVEGSPRIGAVPAGGISPAGRSYHRDCDAHPLPGVPGSHALPSAERRLDTRGRPARPTGGNR